MSEISKYEERLAIYDRLIDQSADFDRKGKTMPYTSANGHMFSQLIKMVTWESVFQKKFNKRISKNLILHIISVTALK